MENVLTEPDLPPNNVTGQLPPPAPVPPRALPFKRLYRDPSGPIGGVAAGMAGYFGVDPVLVRLLWLVALFSGIGFFAYVMFWVIVPKARDWPPPGYPSSLGPGGASDGVSGALLTGLFIVALAAALGASLGGLGDFVLPVALIGLGIYLLNQRPAQPPSAVAQLDEAAEPLPARAPATESSRFNVTGLVLSLLALLAGAGWMLDSAGVLSLTFTAYLAMALIVVGLGSIASLWLGRARGLIPLGLLFGAGLLVSSAVEPWFAERTDEAGADSSSEVEWSAGEPVFKPVALAELEPQYALGMGELTLDLSGLDLEGTHQHVRVKVGLGEAHIIVPKDASLEISGKVGMGKIEALGSVGEGMGQKVNAVENGLTPGRLSIELEVGLGEGKVYRGN